LTMEWQRHGYPEDKPWLKEAFARFSVKNMKRSHPRGSGRGSTTGDPEGLGTTPGGEGDEEIGGGEEQEEEVEDDGATRHAKRPRPNLPSNNPHHHHSHVQEEDGSSHLEDIGVLPAFEFPSVDGFDPFDPSPDRSPRLTLADSSSHLPTLSLDIPLQEFDHFLLLNSHSHTHHPSTTTETTVAPSIATSTVTIGCSAEELAQIHPLLSSAGPSSSSHTAPGALTTTSAPALPSSSQPIDAALEKALEKALDKAFDSALDSAFNSEMDVRLDAELNAGLDAGLVDTTGLEDMSGLEDLAGLERITEPAREPTTQAATCETHDDPTTLQSTAQDPSLSLSSSAHNSLDQLFAQITASSQSPPSSALVPLPSSGSVSLNTVTPKPIDSLPFFPPTSDPHPLLVVVPSAASESERPQLVAHRPLLMDPSLL
jgi:hypothetical protein